MLDDRDLVRRENLGDDSLDTNCSSNRLCGALMITGQQDRLEPERPELLDRLGRGLLDRVGDVDRAPDAQVAGVAAPCDPHRSRSIVGCSRFPYALGNIESPRVTQPARPPGHHELIAHVSADPQARRCLHTADDSGVSRLRGRRVRDRRSDRVLGRALERAGVGEQLHGLGAWTRVDPGDAHLPTGHGAGLVQNDGVDAPS